MNTLNQSLMVPEFDNPKRLINLRQVIEIKLSSDGHNSEVRLIDLTWVRINFLHEKLISELRNIPPFKSGLDF